MGCRPTWDAATGRVTGIEVLPPAAMGRPRIDVTWRISGLFRDLFPAQIALIDAAVQAVAARDEADDENPLAAARRATGAVPTRSPASSAQRPGAYGAGVERPARRRRRARRHRCGLSRRRLACLWRRGRRGRLRCPAPSPRASRRPICWCMRATIPARDLLEGAEDAAFIGGFAAAAALARPRARPHHPRRHRPATAARATACRGAGAHRARARNQSALHRRARCVTARAAPPSSPRPSTG